MTSGQPVMAGRFLRYNGQSWQSVPAPDTTWLTDVSMASSQLGYFVGNFGTILRWNGASWTKIANSPTSLTLRGVAVTAAQASHGAGLWATAARSCGSRTGCGGR